MTKTANETILELVAAHGREGAQNLVTEWCNVPRVEIDEKGDIWVERDGNGHWLSADKLAQFIRWCEAQ